MFRDWISGLGRILSVPDENVPRVQDFWDRAVPWLIGISTALLALSLSLLWIGSDLNFWIVSGPMLFLAALALRQLSQRTGLSVGLNVFLLLLTLYAATAGQSDLAMVAFTAMIKGLVVILAALTLTPPAGFVWAEIVTLSTLANAAASGALLGNEVRFNTIVVTILAVNLGALVMVTISRRIKETEEDLRQEIRQREISIDIGHSVTSAVDPHTIVEEAVERIYETSDYDHIGLYLINEETDTAVLMDAAGTEASELLERNFTVSLIGTTVLADAIKRKRRRLLFSWQELVDPKGRPIEFTIPRLPIRAELVIPLVARGEVLGALDILSARIDPFPEEDVHTLEGLVGHIANALHGARLLNDVQRRHELLEELYDQTERRTRYLETTAQLARAINTLMAQEDLLADAAELVSTGLDMYHTGVFLLDDTGRWAVLMAASSEGGQRMLERGHKLRVGSQGIVGWVAKSGEPRIALDVGEDAVFFDNPDLPATRSEIALPLMIGDEMLGVLDVQSVREAAFSEEDVSVLQTMADQIAVAIQNTRLFQETQKALNEVQALQRFYVAQEWERLSAQRGELEAEYRELGVSGVDEAWTEEMEMAFSREEPVVLSDLDQRSRPKNPVAGGEGGNGRGDGSISSAMAVPIKLRGEVIGVLGLEEMDEERTWSDDDVSMATSIADQLALALENARLFEEAQRRANQLAAAAEVARDAVATLKADELLDETVTLISEQFQFYHAGVFLLDERNEYAVLQAASSSGGKEMLQAGHRLKVGEVGIVGHVASAGEPRVALDVEKDAAHFDNPYLPETRSEMAIPLRQRDRIIGVLDVQSKNSHAFSEEDVSVLQTLADQLAAAIANARLFERVREDAARRALVNEVTQAAASSLDIKELLGRSGQAISSRLDMPSLVYDWDAETRRLDPVAIHDAQGEAMEPDDELGIIAEMNPTMFEALRHRQLEVLHNVASHTYGAAARLAQDLGLQDAAYIPLVSRGQVLGVLELGRHKGHPPLDEGELAFLETVATNLGVAWENARLFQEAVETAERLKEVDRLKSQFLANMSHELRTPLNSIIGFSRVILKEIDGPLTDMQRTDLQTVYDSGQHLLGLINDILDISKIAAGKMELAFDDVEIGEIVSGVMSTAIALVKDKPVELQEDVPEDIPVIYADARRIRQVLLNLVSNAAKFTEEGHIRVSAIADERKVTVAVKDTGVGIPAEKQKEIFEPFTQVDGSSTRSVGGTGLGLSICQSFVELHGGRIWLESTLDEGSTFYFTLPIEGPPDEQAEEEEVEEIEVTEYEPQEASGERTVLCVEDDKGVITLFRRYLSKRGYRVLGLSDPTRVVEEVKRVQPHAITLDVMMPGKDGWSVIQELKDDPETRHIPVVMCSIVADEDRGISLGAADYLVKPILEQDLVAALDRLDREAGRHLVLVVDDEASHRQLLRRMIEDQDGYEVVEATGGKEAIEMLQHVRPQIIMLDLMMPEMDGFAVLESVKGDPSTRSIPIVVVTAKELTPEDRQRLNDHVGALIQKGLMKQEELLADVAAALKKLDGRFARNEEELTEVVNQ